MIQHYSLGIPRTGARHLAGHGSMEGIPVNQSLSRTGNYYLDRECLVPPEELQRKIFPRLEETEAMNNAKPERDQDIAEGCFMNLLRWLRIVLLQDAVFLRRKYPTLNIWLESVFNNVMFENFSRELLQEIEHGETLQYVRVSRAMPDLAHQLHEQHENQMNTMSAHHQSVLIENKQEHVTANNNNRQEHIFTRDIILQNLRPFISVLTDLSNSGLNFHTQSTTDTRVQLADSSYIANITTDPSFIDPNLITSTNSFTR
jgi:Centromere DNA-binding protein complex CBF3 subunit, domain 2